MVKLDPFCVEKLVAAIDLKIILRKVLAIVRHDRYSRGRGEQPTARKCAKMIALLADYAG
jgi:hypothetical protein